MAAFNSHSIRIFANVCLKLMSPIVSSYLQERRSLLLIDLPSNAFHCSVKVFLPAFEVKGRNLSFCFLIMGFLFLREMMIFQDNAYEG